MSVLFKNAPLKTSVGTTARTLDGWFGDILNVREFGATGDGTTDDRAAIQAAFDLAFGDSVTAPHGWTQRHLNRPVFFPAGKYRITAPLNLKYVCGGRIFGAGKWASQIRYFPSVSPGPTNLTPVFNINGASHLNVERLYMESLGDGSGSMTGTNTCCINLDWDGTTSGNGNDGLHSNHFQEITLGGGVHTVIIGHAGGTLCQGHNNLFLNCDVTGPTTVGSQYGFDVRGPAATNNMTIGGGGAGHDMAWIRCPAGGGSMNMHNISGPSGDATLFSDAVFVMESGKQALLSGGRCESVKLLRMNSGMVTIQAVNGTDGNTGNWINVTGGKCIMEGCFVGNAKLVGSNSQLRIAGNYYAAPNTNPWVGYTGTLVNMDYVG